MNKLIAAIALLAVLGTASAHGYNRGYEGYTREVHVRGVWGYWGEWSYCTKECGGGSQTRTRECRKPDYHYGDYKECEGDASETRECNTQACPVDGAWTEWGQFGDCSVKCGHGTKNRTRTCTNPEPANGGKDCYGDDTDTTYCYIYKCPVDGRWSHWTYWSSCSGNCGEGLRVRSRSCNYPAPANGGKDCEGENSETEICKHYRQCYSGYQPHGNGYGPSYGPPHRYGYSGYNRREY